MNIETFAMKHHLATTRCVDDGTLVVKGRHGEVYQYSDDELGVLVMPEPKRFRLWGHARKEMLTAGMKVRQDADHEGAVSFDPSNKKAAKLAIKLAGIRRKRVPSPAQLAALSNARSHISNRSAAPAAL